MADTCQKMREKVRNIFITLAGNRGEKLVDTYYHDEFTDIIAKSFFRKGAKSFGKKLSKQESRDLGFHMADWAYDAAAIVAIHLFPEKFTQREIQKGIINFLVHAPNHIVAAAKIVDQPVSDIFEIGALDGAIDEE